MLGCTFLVAVRSITTQLTGAGEQFRQNSVLPSGERAHQTTQGGTPDAKHDTSHTDVVSDSDNVWQVFIANATTLAMEISRDL
jgi:hypothetical protein